jgi:VWFA-related protein
MSLRLLTRIILISTACAVFTAPVTGQQQPGRSDDVVRVSTDLVQTDFMVFDKQGNFVDGLKREQFVLKVDNKAREISFFDRVAAGTRNEEAQLAAARGTAKEGIPPQPLDRGRIVVFFIDDLHLSPTSVKLTRDMLKQFVTRDMQQNDQAAIFSASGQLGFLQQVSDNRDVMLTAIDRLRAQQTMVQTAEYPPMTEYHALTIEQHDNDVLNFFVDALVKENPMLPRQTAANMVMARAAQIIEDSSSITTRSLSSFRSLIDATASLPGRKLIFFISDGFLIERNRSDNHDRLMRITAAAARSGAVIYSIDARGLSAGLPDASKVVAADPSGRLSRGAGGELSASRDGMHALAADTGGRALFNTNNLSASVATGLKETSAYYLLAWRPENDEQRNPKFRRLEVSVLGRPELVVRFRRGFGEAPEPAAKRRKEEATAPARKTAAEEMGTALRAPYPLTSLPVAAALTYLDSAQYGGTLTTSVKVATSALTVEGTAENRSAVMDVAGIVLNDQGKSVSSFNKRITIKAPANPNSRLPNQVFYNHFSILKPGIYQVRVAAIDVRRGTRGSAHQWIGIPNLQSNELTLSSLVVGERKSETEIAATDTNSNEAQKPAELRTVNMNVDRIFARSSYLRFLTFVYNAQTTKAVAQPQNQNTSATVPPATNTATTVDLAVQVQVFRDNEPVITSPLRKISVQPTTDVQRIPYAADVMLNDLQPGAYVLQVAIIDRLAKTKAIQKLNFQVE